MAPRWKHLFPLALAVAGLCASSAAASAEDDPFIPLATPASRVAPVRPVGTPLVPPAPSADGAPVTVPNPGMQYDTYAPPEEQWYSPFADQVIHDPSVPEATPPWHWELTEGFLEALSWPEHGTAEFLGTLLGAEHDHPPLYLDDDARWVQPIPERPPLVFEWGEDFLSPGFLSQGIETPTGAVMRPALWVWGVGRSGVNYIDTNNGPNVVEWANRLDLFAQLNLTGTERLLVGLRPLDQERGTRRDFAGYDFRGGDWQDGSNIDVQTLFFEGDFGEIFPNLDPYDMYSLDYGFSVGRQPMLFQQGLLINEDMLDAFTVTRNTLYGDGNLNLRMTGVYAWDGINRNNQAYDNDAQLFGLFTESDFREATVNLDVAYVNSQTNTLRDQWAFGLSAINRFYGYHNTYNSSAHVLASWASEGETQASGDGVLLFHQLSWTPHGTEDLIYLNSFWAIDQFTSPARGTLGGGPLGQTGILFSAAGLGRFGAPLSNQADDAAGASLGYQMFFDETRQQVIWEVGGRSDTDGTDDAALATGMRYQRAIGQHWIFLVDGFVSKQEGDDVVPGGRFEFLTKF